MTTPALSTAIPAGAADRWLRAAEETLRRVAETQREQIDRAGEVFAEAIAADALVHVFGSGHSRMNTEEMFPRIGSFPGFHPVVELALTNHHQVVGPNGLRQAMFLERVEGFGRVVLQQMKLHRGDAFLIFSSTGINGVVIEIALYARKMRLPVVAVTSFDHSLATASRHPSGRKLMEVADIAIDNCSPAGDAATEIEGLPYRVGPVSSIGAIAVVNALKAATAEKLVARGKPPVVLTSPHFVGQAEGEEQLERVYEEYFRRIARAYDADGAIPVPANYD
ncbi:MAG: SIS domain-containing protein [Chloroflexota bacterium]|nr:SIS domain-containing protein [Chloroflexota bacterium]